MRMLTLFFLILLLLLANIFGWHAPQADPAEESQPSADASTPEGSAPQPESSAANTSARESSPPEQSVADTSSEASSAIPEDPASRPEQPSVACPSVNGALHVEGTRLVDKTGAPVQLRGVSTHGIAWFPDYINLDCFRQLRQEWNVNAVRLAMYTAESGGYCAGGDRNALKALVDQGVRFAAEADLYVIIDWHILSDQNPNMHLDEARAFFRELSARYAGLDHVIYEICNEPNGATTWQDVKSYALEVIGEIRKNDPNAVILVGTPNWSQSVDLAAADPIREYENLMYTLHFYAATHKDDLRSRMQAAVDSGLPVFVSEYGICDASGNGSLDIEQANAWIDLLDQYGVSYLAWNLSNKNESSSILRPECGKTAGFTAEDLSACGQWLYRMLTGRSPAQPPREEDEKEPTDAPEVPEAPMNSETPPQSEPPQNTTELQEGSLAITLTIVNSWASDQADYRQYTLTVTNSSGTDLSEWSVTLPFQEAFTLSDSWNGVFSVQGTDLRIASAAYNGAIPAGGTVTDIGFILRIP